MFLDKNLYQINTKLGFLPAVEPLQSLPVPYYLCWEHTITKLHHLLSTHQLRSHVDSLPLLSVENLTSIPLLQRAYSILGFICHSYVWGSQPQKPTDCLPSNISLPYYLVAQKLGLKAVCSASGVCLWNWRFTSNNNNNYVSTNNNNNNNSYSEEKIGLDLDEIEITNTFTNTKDEEWFYLITICVESCGGVTLDCINTIYNTINSNKPSLVVVGAQLARMNKCIIKMNQYMSKMFDNCDPSVFYWLIRPYLSGWQNMEDMGLPLGLRYKGIAQLNDNPNEYRQYAGGSAAQTPLIQALDIVLGVEHYPTHKDWKKQSNKYTKSVTYLTEMRNYMLEGHRVLLYDLASVDNIKDYVMRLKRTKEEVKVVQNYNSCVDNLTKFRNIHLQMVTKYIVLQAKKPLSNRQLLKADHGIAKFVDDNNAVIGTGGTDLIPFLKQCRDETIDAKVIN